MVKAGWENCEYISQLCFQIVITTRVYKMFPALVYIFLICSPLLLCAGSGNLTRPTVKPFKYAIYVHPQGNDVNNSLADSLTPLQSFDSVFSVLRKKTQGLSGDQHCVVYISKGVYALKKPIEQMQQDIYPSGEKQRTLHVSFKGIDDSVIIDGSAIQRSGGYGLLNLCGSNIEISRLTLRHAPSFGLAIGQPFARSTHVFISNVIIDTTFSHGISLGNVDAKNEDTVLISHCRFHETNTMNAGGLSNQWGSALKLFGARHVMIDSCHFEHNWSEAISINNSSNVSVSACTFLNNFAPSVYCDIAEHVTIERNLFLATLDTMMFKKGKRGMVSILLSNEAWNPLAVDHRTSDIDIFSNVHINQGGVLDIWEGTVSFLQKAIVSDVRYAFNSSFGMSAGAESTNAGIISITYSTPFPFNRVIENLSLYGNIFSVNATLWPRYLWMRGSAMLASKCSFAHNRWNGAFPTLGEYSKDDIAEMPDTLLWDQLELPALMKQVPSLTYVQKDFFGSIRGVQTTHAGAFEFTITNIDESRHSVDIVPQMKFYHQEMIGLVELPEQWRNMQIVCIDLRGRVYKLSEDKFGMIRLPFTGYFMLIPIAYH